MVLHNKIMREVINSKGSSAWRKNCICISLCLLKYKEHLHKMLISFSVFLTTMMRIIIMVLTQIPTETRRAVGRTLGLVDWWKITVCNLLSSLSCMRLRIPMMKITCLISSTLMRPWSGEMSSRSFLTWSMLRTFNAQYAWRAFLTWSSLGSQNAGTFIAGLASCSTWITTETIHGHGSVVHCAASPSTKTNSKVYR